METYSKEGAKQFCEAYRSEAKHLIKGVNDPFLHQMMFEFAQAVIASNNLTIDKSYKPKCNECMDTYWIYEKDGTRRGCTCHN